MNYHQKLIISGLHFEYYKYEKSLRRDFTRKKKEKKEAPHEQMLIDDLIKTEAEIVEARYVKRAKRKDSISRTRTQVRRLTNSNPDLTKFVTLTFKENILDVTVANRLFNKFIMRLKYKYLDFKYVSFIEFQIKRGIKNGDGGAVHYHFLCDLPYIKNKELTKIWSHGHVKINKLENVDNIGAYVCKYLNKDMTDERLFNRKKYFCSKNIEKPTTIFDEEIIKKVFSEFGLDDLKPDFESTFSNEFIGSVEYKAFKLKI
ncbi:MAG: hypothetical protein WCI36_04670 [bacterium]